MKNTLILYFIITPITFIFCQSFNEITNINSYNQFAKVMIENGYELDEKTFNGAIYKKEKILSEGKSEVEAIATFDGKSNIFHIMFLKSSSVMKKKYDMIFSNVKEKCKFSRIVLEKDVPIYFGGGDWASYGCEKISLSFSQKNGWLMLMNWKLN